MAVVQQYLPTTDPGAVGAANFLVEISAGNGGKISTKDFQKARQAALPYSRPTYMGLTAGGKVCSQCGTNRTPQWREGPEGPKTLCNACGVKRVRQMRLVSDGNKRRPPVPTFATKTAASLAKQSSGSFSSDNNAVMRRRDRSPSIRRPQRKAAAKAASRTAEFATTGDWPDDDGDATYSNPSAGQYTYTEPSNSEDSAALNSDSAEEVAWTPMRGPGPAHSSMPQPPSPFPAVGHETAAAVNLLSMSITQQDLGVGRNNGGSGPGPGFQQTHALEQQALQKSLASVNFNSASLASMAYAMMNGDSSVEEHTSTDQAVEALQDALRSLPSKEHVNMLMLKEDLENSAREAAAADAAVAAVAKILAIKQAAAIRARATAASAAKKMHHWMNNLDEQYGWSSAIKKQRTL